MFADVPSTFWAEEAIGDLAAKQLIKGVSAERFAPAQKVTRAEFAAMLVRLLGIQAEGPVPYSDVTPGKWYADAVAAAADAGIVYGTSGDRFAPEAPIKRQEMAAMLVRAYAYAVKQPNAADVTRSGFADIAGSPDWVQEAVNTAYALGFIKGHTPSRFAPEGLATRAESAQVMFNLLNKLQ
jgi:hypothetical protein